MQTNDADREKLAFLRASSSLNQDISLKQIGMQRVIH